MSAVISSCGQYRYWLERDLQLTGDVWGILGVNPSKADGTRDDASTRKFNGFGLRNGCRRYVLANPFAYRATAVKELARVIDPMGPENNSYLLRLIEEVDVIVPCWGDRGKIPKQLWANLNHLRALVLHSGKPVKIFGLTKSCDPMHPLMLGYATPMIDWKS